MDQPTSKSVVQFANDLQLEVHRNPFHSAEGIELRKTRGRTLECVGYIFGPDETKIYKIVRNRWDTFAYNRLWFLYGWLIRPPQNQPTITTLNVVRSSDFREEDFLKLAKEELGSD